MKLQELTTYELIQEHHLKDLQSEGYILKHKKSGAKVVLLSNDDENKVFSIGFRTPPKDSTGLPHILEHSVWFKAVPVKRPVCRIGERFLKYIFKRNDISG